jgi:hypothetical protein
VDTVDRAPDVMRSQEGGSNGEPSEDPGRGVLGGGIGREEEQSSQTEGGSGGNGEEDPGRGVLGGGGGRRED